MKKCVLFILTGMLVISCTRPLPRNRFVVEGRLAGLENGLLYLHYTDSAGNRLKDSTSLAGGRFVFGGEVSEPCMAWLQLKEEKRSEKNAVGFFLQAGKTAVSLTFNEFRSAVFTGSPLQDQLAELNRMRESTGEGKTARQADYAFFDTHPESLVTASQLIYHVSTLPIDSLEMYFGRLGATVQQSRFGSELAVQIAMIRSGSPGSMAKDFATLDINGDSLRLSALRGRYVLLDFWASWCGPCRKGNPHLKELYARYRAKGIEFIGISDDDSKPDAWRRAVSEDALPWRHVLRGFDQEKLMNGEENEGDINKKFGIHSIPTKILIDPKGMIIGRYGDEEEPLDRRLSELFEVR
jgi:thiol-disulfide isomerase/thioredoxin